MRFAQRGRRGIAWLYFAFVGAPVGPGDDVVPFAVEGVSGEWDGVEFGVSGFDAFEIAAGVAFGSDLEPGAGSGGGDEIDDDFVAGQGPAPPVH